MFFAKKWIVLFIFVFLVYINIHLIRSPSLQKSWTGKARRFPRDWFRQRQTQHPVQSMIPLPLGVANVPSIQFKFEREDKQTKIKREERQNAVKDAFLHTWKGYKNRAWLHDELGPVKGDTRNPYNGWGATLIDSLDTLWIMGLKDEFELAVQALDHIDFSYTNQYLMNVFETTIRYLGGLLSAYDLSEGHYPVLLEKAVDIADFLYVAFDTPNRMPVLRWHWPSSAKGEFQQADSQDLLAEVGTLSVEFTRLSQITGDPKYYDAVQRITDMLQAQQSQTKLPGMWPITIDIRTPSLTWDRIFSFGACSDSLYEYLPKV